MPKREECQCQELGGPDYDCRAESPEDIRIAAVPAVAVRGAAVDGIATEESPWIFEGAGRTGSDEVGTTFKSVCF
jgi:hypothetical protein